MCAYTRGVAAHRGEEGVRYPRAGVTGSWEPPRVGAGSFEKVTVAPNL